MGVEENKAKIRRFGDGVWGGTDLEAARDVFHSPYRDPELGDVTVDQLIGFFREYHRGWPDLRVTRHDVWGEGDWVTQYLEAAGTDMGGIHGLAPTGRTIVLRELNLFRFEDGKVAERIGFGDFTGLLKQVGAIPPALYRMVGIAQQDGQA